MSQLDLSYYLRNVLEMTGCFNSACSAIIREKWMLFAYFYPVSSHMKKDRKYVFSPVSVFCSPLRCNSAGRGQPLNLYMCLTACSYDIFE